MGFENPTNIEKGIERMREKDREIERYLRAYLWVFFFIGSDQLEDLYKNVC